MEMLAVAVSPAQGAAFDPPVPTTLPLDDAAGVLSAAVSPAQQAVFDPAIATTILLDIATRVLVAAVSPAQRAAFDSPAQRGAIDPPTLATVPALDVAAGLASLKFRNCLTT